MNAEHSPAWTALTLGTAPVPGAHLVTLRCGYCHHGIYVGDSKVVHYAGYCRALHHGPVEEVALVEFAAGQQVWIDASVAPKYPGHEVVRRARSRLDEDRYRLLTNNCEHFCAWCLAGESRSEQVQAWWAHPRSALRSAVWLVKAFHGSAPATGSPDAGAPSALHPGHIFPQAGWQPSL
ncbi:lecithin retinol acyltransferase family protein [Cupriavidus sp. CV2]|uniref:lecithin retinol acyltransferase family protein n=1 Tax=Cupriavidus ulmosensis TaxID=3065913 RepID=UPI00296AC79D|nr:lecithin retinol acyltransferase family protein [Cupriavidus sp. CV2]MDW3688674.1 lecithin retinol acyltransferase family protein [Cupriavidus sp. CV2]